MIVTRILVLVWFLFYKYTNFFRFLIYNLNLPPKLDKQYFEAVLLSLNQMQLPVLGLTLFRPAVSHKDSISISSNIQ